MTNPTTGGGYNPTLFGMPQYRNFGVNAGMPNFGYGWNGAFPYTPYPIPGYLPNNMMQYPLPGNAFGFGGSFTNPFPNNGTPCMPNSNNNNNTSNNGNNSNGGSRNNNNGHNRNGGNGGNNHGGSGNGGNNNNGGNLNGGNASNGPSVFQFPDTSLQHLKYEGYTDPSEHLALFLNNVEQQGIQNEIAIKQRFFSTLRGIALQWY